MASRPSLHSRTHTPDGYHGSRARLYRPPLSPAPSSPSDSRQQMNSKKRSRASSPAVGSRQASKARPREQQTGYFATPESSASQAGAWSSITPNATFESPALRSAASPPPFVETRYDLAYGPGGGLDTYDSTRSDYDRDNLNTRGRVWSAGKDARRSSDQRQRPSEPNGGPSYSAGLTYFVLNLVTDVAGRMLEFCKQSTPFKGFQAGGGKAYTVAEDQDDDTTQQTRRSMWKDEDSAAQSSSYFEMISTPIPGQYPDSPPEERSAKRKKGDGGGWIMVPTPGERNEPTKPNTSRSRMPLQLDGRRTPGTSDLSRPHSRNGSRRSLPATMVARRHSSTATYAGSPTANGTTASTASPRVATLHHSPSIAGHKRQSSGSRPSTASGHYNDRPSTSLSPDVQHYQARMKKHERAQDASMRKMNAKLQEMIKEGKAALGTKVDVEMDDTDFD